MLGEYGLYHKAGCLAGMDVKFAEIYKAGVRTTLDQRVKQHIVYNIIFVYK